MKIGQLVDMLREYADNLEENYGRDKEFDWSPNTYMLGAPFLGTYDGYVNLKNPIDEDDNKYDESKKKSNSQVKKEVVIKVPVNSFKESKKAVKEEWGQYSDDDTYDKFDILENYDAVDLCDLCNSREGSAIADQLQSILIGEPLSEQNSNALEYIKSFAYDKGENTLVDALSLYLDNEDIYEGKTLGDIMDEIQ